MENHKYGAKDDSMERDFQDGLNIKECDDNFC